MIHTATLSAPTPLIQPKNSLKIFFQRCVEVYHKHSDLISSLGLYALNLTIFVSKIIQAIPKIIPKLAYTALSFVGVIYLNQIVQDLIKKGRDFIFACANGNWKEILFTASKVAVKALNLLLMGVSLVASVFLLFGNPITAFFLWALTRPFSIGSLVLDILSQVTDFFENRVLVRSFEQINEGGDREERIKRVVANFICHLNGSSNKNGDFSYEKVLAREVFFQLNYFTISTFQSKFKEKNQEDLGHDEIIRLFNGVATSIQISNDYIKGNLGLHILGYISLAIYKLFPMSLIQSITTLLISGLYTSKTLRQKIDTDRLAHQISL